MLGSPPRGGLLCKFLCFVRELINSIRVMIDNVSNFKGGTMNTLGRIPNLLSGSRDCP
jgi:hypothetical protein